MAFHHQRDLCCRKSGGKFVFGLLMFAVVAVVLRFSMQLPRDIAPDSIGDSGDSLVELTLVRNAQSKGAVCLDGSSPAYHIQRGDGSGSKNWLLHIEGGGWCNSVVSCAARKVTALGSSKFMQPVTFSGMLSSSASDNPNFYNWNRVKIRYCDGASFAGEVENELKDGANEPKLFFRGRKIWQEIMKDLLAAGLVDAQKALLSGCSAGGLATFLHCDDFRSLLPKDATVKCLADGGFFLNEKDISGTSTLQTFYQEVIELHINREREALPLRQYYLTYLSGLVIAKQIDVTFWGVVEGLPRGCTSSKEPSQCFFPENIIGNIKTPLFIINPAYDFWQIQNALAPDTADPDQLWNQCKRSIDRCTPDQIKVLQEFRHKLLGRLSRSHNSTTSGTFVDSCFSHCQTWLSNTWHSPTSPRLSKKTIAEAVGEWFFDIGEVGIILAHTEKGPIQDQVV